MTIHDAAIKGDIDEIERLLAESLDSINLQDQYGTTPLHRAAIHGHADVVRALLVKGASADIRDNTGSLPLHWACHGGIGQVTHSVIHHTNNINQQNAVGNTPLMEAVIEDSLTDVFILLDRKCDVFARNLQGETALHLAAKRGNHWILTALLDKYEAADQEIDVKDNHGQTPLHWAVRFDDPIPVHSLLQAGAMIDETDNSGITPLAVAADRGNVNVVRFLLEHGADPNVKGQFGTSALSLATGNHHRRVVELLLHCGATEGLGFVLGTWPETDILKGLPWSIREDVTKAIQGYKQQARDNK